MKNKQKLMLGVVAAITLVGLVGVFSFSQPGSLALNNNQSINQGVYSQGSGIFGGLFGSESPGGNNQGPGSGDSGGTNPGTNPGTTPDPSGPQYKPCPTCKATGEITCPKCNGAVECWKCRTCGSIWPRTKSATCMNCYNKGIFPTIIDFYDCSCSNGKITCPDCKGTKKILT